MLNQLFLSEPWEMYGEKVRRICILMIGYKEKRYRKCLGVVLGLRFSRSSTSYSVETTFVVDFSGEIE